MNHERNVIELFNRLKEKLGCQKLLLLPKRVSGGSIIPQDSSFLVVKMSPKLGLIYYKASSYQRIDSLIIKLASTYQVKLDNFEFASAIEIAVDLSKPIDLFAALCQHNPNSHFTDSISAVKLTRLCMKDELDDKSINRIPKTRFIDNRTVIFKLGDRQVKKMTIKDKLSLTIDSQLGRINVDYRNPEFPVDTAVLEVSLKNTNGYRVA